MSYKHISFFLNYQYRTMTQTKLVTDFIFIHHNFLEQQKHFDQNYNAFKSVGLS